jgi:hypothetical protein
VKPTYYDCVARDSNKAFIVDLAKKDAMALTGVGRDAPVLTKKTLTSTKNVFLS